MAPHIPDPDVAIPGFNLFRNDRTSTLGGGVCVFLKHTIVHYSLHPIRADVESK